MPLSEDEQRILHEIEQQFYEHDPALARTVGETTLYRHYFRNLKWAALAFLVGVGVLIATLMTFSYVVAFVFGFGIMLAAALWFERNARKLGRAGLQQMTSSMRAGGLRDLLGNTRTRMRDRFRRSDDE